MHIPESPPYVAVKLNPYIQEVQKEYLQVYIYWYLHRSIRMSLSIVLFGEMFWFAIISGTFMVPRGWILSICIRHRNNIKINAILFFFWRSRGFKGWPSTSKYKLAKEMAEEEMNYQQLLQKIHEESLTVLTKDTPGRGFRVFFV